VVTPKNPQNDRLHPPAATNKKQTRQFDICRSQSRG